MKNNGIETPTTYDMGLIDEKELRELKGDKNEDKEGYNVDA
jgi:hypothetical protein